MNKKQYINRAKSSRKAAAGFRKIAFRFVEKVIGECRRAAFIRHNRKRIAAALVLLIPVAFQEAMEFNLAALVVFPVLVFLLVVTWK
jgi:hypothetical protein